MSDACEALVTVADFNDICRVCMQTHDDMVDIFGSGMENQLMEVTRLKVRLDDKLPKSVCQNCLLEMDYLLKFLEKAKSSDVYLRSLLSTDEIGQAEKKKDKDTLMNRSKSSKTKGQKPKSKVSKKSKKLKKGNGETQNNKLYLIVVPKVDDGSEIENEICVKDLSIDNDNVTHYCKALVKSYFADHTYPKEYHTWSDVENSNENSKLNILIKTNELDASFIYKINLYIFECIQCKECFDEDHDLSTHYLLMHNSELPFLNFTYICPICKSCEINKSDFLSHLESHKTGGFQFIKVSSTGEAVHLRDEEKHVFINLLPEDRKCNKILQISLNTYKCVTCFQTVDSQDLNEHLKFHSFKLEQNFILKFTCPVCNMFFINSVEKLLQHLMSHKLENYYFIKVNGSGQPLELTENEMIFESYNEAVNLRNLMNLNNQQSKVFEITNINSCNNCEYLAESFTALCDHYHTEHPGLQMPVEHKYSCPICNKDFLSDQMDKSKIKLYEHLKNHKDEEGNMHFIEVNKNGTISKYNEEHSGIFTQSQLLHGLLNKSHFIDFNQIYCPDLILSVPTNASSELGKIKHKEHFKKKTEVIDHLKSEQLKNTMKQTDSLNHICEKCGKKFSGKLAYKKHFAKHSKGFNSAGSGKRPMCSICNKTFANRTSLCHHMRNHMREDMGNEFEASQPPGIICEKCGRTFSNHTCLMKHKKVHKAGKENTALKCEICNREFFRQSSFDRHKSAHLNPKYFDCDVCKLPLSSAVSLQRHLEVHKTSSNTYDCKACNTSFLTKESLTAHQTHTGHYLDRKPLECNVCHEKFFIGRKFTEHIKTHPKYKMGECTLCGKRLSTVQSLMLHMGRHFESNSILCPHCGKQFFEERNYHRHLLTHEGIKPFACDVEGCEKCFYTLFELNRHKKYHSNTRDFVCPYCSKSFHEANHLTVHVRTHTGERPYICPHCNKGFITRTRCKHHIKLVHQGIGYDLIQSSISKKVAVFEAIEAMA